MPPMKSLILHVTFCVGGVVSPLAANVLLHGIVDNWFVKEVARRIPTARIFRYADDIIMTFEREKDAEKVLAVTRKRFAKFKRIKESLPLIPQDPWPEHALGQYAPTVARIVARRRIFMMSTNE